MNNKKDDIIQELKKIFLMYGDINSFNNIEKYIIDGDKNSREPLSFGKPKTFEFKIKLPLMTVEDKEITFFKPVKESMGFTPLKLIEDDSRRVFDLLNNLVDLLDIAGKDYIIYQHNLSNIEGITDNSVLLDELKKIYDFYQDKLNYQRVIGYIVNSPESHIVKVETEDSSLYKMPFLLPIAKFDDDDSEGLLNSNRNFLATREREDVDADAKYITEIVNQIISNKNNS